MKKHKMLISLAGLAVAVATTATVAAYTLAGDGSSAPAGESAGTPFQDDKSTFGQAPDTIDDGKGSVSVTNPDVGGATDGTVSGGQQGTVVNSDDPPAGKVLPDEGGVVPIGTSDGDVGPTRNPKDLPSHLDPPLPEPVDGAEVPAEVPAIGPAIEPIEVGEGVAVGEPSPAQGLPRDINPAVYAEVVELAMLDLQHRLGLEDISSIDLVKISKREWGDTSLGNPQPGVSYAQVIVLGFALFLEADGAIYLYHTSMEQAVFVVEALGIPVSDDEAGEVVEAPTPTDDVDNVGGELVRVTSGLAELQDSLLAAGAEVKVTGEVVSEGIFSVDGSVLEVNGERVQVMNYGDATALEAEADSISRDGSSVGTTMVTWVGPPHFFRTETAIVLYLGESPTVIEALIKVMGPQFAGR